MAKCALCGAKISAFEDPHFIFEDNSLCSDCFYNYEIVTSKSEWIHYSDRALSSAIEYIRNKCEGAEGDAEVHRELLNEINDILGGYKSFAEKQTAIAAYFPTDKTKEVGGLFAVNQEDQVFAIKEFGRYKTSAFKYADLENFEVNEDGVSIIGGTAGAAAIGALIAGTAGAIIGSATTQSTEQKIRQIDIILTFKGFDRKPEVIQVLNPHTTHVLVYKHSSIYQEKMQICNQIVSSLRQILNSQKDVEISEKVPARAIYAFSVADEILKFRKLTDDGIISEEEFEVQKRKLLALDY